jgi:hypothetical protein
VIDSTRVVIAHVGDSRAYLLRAGRLQAVTRDHTVVEELVDRGLLSAEDAERHPYKNVLSRNLGSRAETRVDVVELALRPGDRLLLCSDGLYGYASAEAIQYLLGSGDAPEHVARDLIELALRGGGGDNVSTIVIEAPAAPASSSEVVRTTGALAWWRERQRFVKAASDSGLTRNPIVRGLPAHEALELVALSLCQAIYHDLEKSTGVNVWTFAQNLASGWFERGGEWKAVRGLIDILGASALIVAELALGGLLAERLRQIDADLVELHSLGHDTLDSAAEGAGESTTDSLAPGDLLEVAEPGASGSLLEAGASASFPAAAARPSERFIDRPTIPFLRPERPVTSSDESAEVMNAITNVITIARSRLSPQAELVAQILAALEAVASDSGGNFAIAVQSARELYGVRPVDNAGVMPLFDAFDAARILAASSVHQLRVSPPIRVRALRALSMAHQRLVGAATGLVLEAVAPYSERLRDAQTVTGELRDAVAKAELRRADLERKFATIVDPNLPWGARGTTEW